MKLGSTGIFASRFGKRLFAIFVLSAILPVLTLGIISFNRVTSQLLDQNRDQQREEVKTIGLAVYERFTLLESELELIASRLELDRDYFSSASSASVTQRISGKLDNLGWFDNEQGYTSLLDSPDQALALEALDQVGETSTPFTIATIADSEGVYRIFMVQSSNNSVTDAGLLVAELNPDFLWNAEIISVNINLCTLDSMNNPLFCSQQVSPEFIESYTSLTADQSFTGNFEWEDETGEAFLSSHWGLFLRNQYDIDDWTVLISTPRQEVLSPITDFQTTFILIFLISVLIVFMLSSSQIRRILVPLKKLMDGTQAYADSNFDSKVVIDSKDEFEDLAESFNTMGGKIAAQFHSIETMAEIDRLILSSLDSDDIVQTVLLRVQDMIRCDQIGMVVQDADGDFNRMYVRSESGQPSAEGEGQKTVESDIALTPKDHVFLQENSKGLIVELDKHTPDMLQAWPEMGAKACLVLPLFIDEVLSAVVILGYKQLPRNAKELLPETRNWADRVAVALSNAKWQEKLYEQANFDALTGLPNRPSFRNYLQQALNRAERNREMVGVLFIDMDRFKIVNDSLGHVIGDEYLKAIAERISKCVRASDMVARLGGDEFTIVVTDEAQSQHIKSSISAVADKLLETIPVPMLLDGQELITTASVGIAIYPLDGENIEDLMKNADSAMYHAKGNGGGQYRFYSEELNLIITKQLMVENELRQALQNSVLELFFQPQVDANTGELVGAESLLRWNHPKNGMTMPSDFIPMAEESRLIVDVDIWVLDAACKQLHSWALEGRPELCIAINLSARFFQSDGIVQRLVMLVEKYHIRASNIELEITEGTLIEDVEATLTVLEELKTLGFQLTIDDFGTGYSSLSYLKQLPISKLKIDQSFVQKCVEDPVDGALVKSIISMAHNLNMKCIAEGVETDDQLAFLQQHGCDEIQGFYFSRPLVVQDFQAKYLRVIEAEAEEEDQASALP